MFIRKILAGLLLAALGVCRSSHAQTNYSIYSDEVDNGFQNWSYNPGNYNFESTNPVYQGTYAITLSNAWNGISFEHTDFNPSPYTNLTFWVNGGAAGGQIVQVNWQYDNSASNGPQYQLPPLPTNSWRQFNIPLAALGVAGVTDLSRLNFQLTSFGSTTVFSLDSVSLTTVLPTTVQVRLDASQTIRAADARWFGLNTAVWDGYFDTAYTSNALAQLGTLILRFPGGSTSDDYHWASNTTDTNTWTWVTSFSDFEQMATNARAQAMITVNYGSGTPQEAAAWVRAANITNHCSFTNWEIGNEEYGSWETDTNANPHDPYTYATRAAQYIAQMKAVDSTIKIGVVSTPGENAYVNSYSYNHPAYNARTGTTNYGWTPILLATLKSLGVTPDFLIHHVYPEYEVDDDQTLLQYATNWASDATLLRQEISDYFGTGGTNIQIVCTENNADAGDQGKQSTSIVNGLYLADSLAQLMKTEIDGFIWWDLRNGQDTSGDFSADLYGWRTYGDLGIIGGTDTNYPTFYSAKLMQYYMRPGDTVVNASSDYDLISSYASRKADGALDLLLINKNETAAMATQISVTNFVPWSTATVRSYGIAEDEATRTNGPAAAQDIATNYFTAASTNFTTNLPPYSLTLFTFAPGAPRLQTVVNAGEVVLQLQGQAGVPYEIQTSTNLISWTSNTMANLTGTVWSATNAVSSGVRYWRAVWLP